MQPRLMRSRTEVIVSGVCGGLGEYFGIDPVIVRLIFVLVTLTSGLGIIVYPVLWMVMPRAPAPGGAFPPPGDGQQMFNAEGEQVSYVMQDAQSRARQAASQARTSGGTTYGDEPPPPSAYNFDPQTGQPIQPSMGQTIHLPNDPNIQPYEQSGQQGVPTAPPRPQKRGRWLAIVLISFGGLILADSLGLDMDIVFPALMIIGGLILLLRR
jgi:phage shock protein C